MEDEEDQNDQTNAFIIFLYMYVRLYVCLSRFSHALYRFSSRGWCFDLAHFCSSLRSRPPVVSASQREVSADERGERGERAPRRCRGRRGRAEDARSPDKRQRAEEQRAEGKRSTSMG